MNARVFLNDNAMPRMKPPDMKGGFLIELILSDTRRVRRSQMAPRFSMFFIFIAVAIIFIILLIFYLIMCNKMRRLTNTNLQNERIRRQQLAKVTTTLGWLTIASIITIMGVIISGIVWIVQITD